VDPSSVADILGQLTSGWKPVAGLAAQELSAARQALAASILQDKTLAEIHATRLPSTHRPAIDAALSSELHAHASQASRAAKPAFVGVVRSALAADVFNPTGRPAWARGAKVLRSLGPFQDANGVLHWVDLIPIVFAEPFAFGDSSSPFAVFPVSLTIFPLGPNQLRLGAGSVWFLANLLANSVPTGNFTGFTIQHGLLTSSDPFAFQNGVYVIPAGATLTLTATPAPAPLPPGSGASADAAACVFTPPATVTIVFQQTSAAIQRLDDFNVQAYGSSLLLHWNQQPPIPETQINELIVPCDASPATFDFAHSSSALFTPSGKALIKGAGWGLPLIATSITSLPQAAGAGAALLDLRTGATLKTEIEPKTAPVTQWLLEVGTDSLFVFARGKAASVRTTYPLWPEAAPSHLNASVDFSVANNFVYSFFASFTGELLFTIGKATAHLDRPVTAAGLRIPFTGQSFLLLSSTTAGSGLFLFSEDLTQTTKEISLALENALLGVLPPRFFLLVAALDGAGDVSSAIVSLFFGLHWLLPTLPDPYAANFDVSAIREGGRGSILGTLASGTVWSRPGHDATLGFVLLPAPASGSNANLLSAALSHLAPASQNASPADLVSTGAFGRGVYNQFPALLDLSTHIDQFGVAVAPLNRYIGGGDVQPAQGTAAPALAIAGMYLVLNDSLVATFALPQESWEPMESTAVDLTGPVACTPPNDGSPLLLNAPNTQQLVRFTPAELLQTNISNVAAGVPFVAIFSLPFGLNAVIAQPNAHFTSPRRPTIHSTFLAAGGQFHKNIPRFKIPKHPPELAGAEQLTLMPPNPTRLDALFTGYTNVDTSGSTGPKTGYGYEVLGREGTPPAASSVGEMFQNSFGQGSSNPGVPVRRIDLAGYGASIFSEWNYTDPNTTGIIKVQFDTVIGRTAHEVIKASTITYPYCVRMVRTITMTRQNAGWVQRTDTGWKAASEGVFEFPHPPDFDKRVHKGAMLGVFNVRNIREQTETHDVGGFRFRKVLFDADVGIDSRVNVLSGGFSAVLQDYPDPLTLVPSRDLVGYMQVLPDKRPPIFPDSSVLAALFQITGPLNPSIACVAEFGHFDNQSGTVFRCSACNVDMIASSNDGNPTPALGAALLGAPQIPRGGGWSMGKRKFTEPEPAALPSDFPVPIVQPATNTDYWFLADVGDVLQVSQPDSLYSLLHSTGTNKVLFELPQIPTSAAISPPPAAPGLQFPQVPPRPSVPNNPGSPNLADVASLLNATGLFPDISSVLSLIQGTMEQINTISQGFHYQKKYTFNPNQKVQIVDIGVLRIDLQYSGKQVDQQNPAVLTYTVNSGANPSWTLDIGPLSFPVTIPLFSNTAPILTISGSFHADEHTPAGLTNLDVSMGSPLALLQNVFSSLQTLAQFLPGGAGAQLDVSLSNAKLTVKDTFSIAEMPLGLGQLTDISFELGLAVQLAPLSVDFSVGLGDPGNPFNWIVSPLAGNGLIDLGVQNNSPALVVQGGIGLGLAIDLGIASGSASVTIAVQLDINGSSITLIAILTGQASVDVLDGLASASLTLSAAVGFSLSPPVPQISYSPPLPAIPTTISIGSETITLLASVSVGIHLTVCWVASVDWDGSWSFSQSVQTPSLSLSV
jgi:hypothetical protein